jgi:hypothetical protein
MPEPANDTGDNEVDMVLKALRELQEKVTNPVIRACLEATCEDITHLVGSGESERGEPVEKPC